MDIDFLIQIKFVSFVIQSSATCCLDFVKHMMTDNRTQKLEFNRQLMYYYAKKFFYF